MAKSRIPVYPRPVSPLNAEPLQSRPSDIFLDDSSDSCSDDDRQASKRRRIETLGEQYLRGDGLLIRSASLRGPLIGWVNPWVKRRVRDTAVRPGMSKPETGELLRETAIKARRPSKTGVLVTPRDKDVVNRPFAHAKVKEGILNGQAEWLRKAHDPEQDTSRAYYESPTPSRDCNEQQGYDHLKSTRTHHYTRGKQQALSADGGLPPNILKQPSTEKKLGRSPTLSADIGKGARANLNSFLRPQSSGSEGSTAPLHTEIQLIQRDSFRTEHHPMSTAKPTVKDTAVNCDWASKRQSARRLPQATILLELECPPLAGSLKALVQAEEQHNKLHTSRDVAKKPPQLDFALSTGAPQVAGHVSISGQAASEKHAVGMTKKCDGDTSNVPAEPMTSANQAPNPSLTLGKITRPSLSTQTSTTTNTNAMPSAQVVPAIRPLLTESYQSTTTKMIEPAVTPTDNGASAHQSPSGKHALSATQNQHGPPTIVNPKSTTRDANSTGLVYTDSMQRTRSHEGIVPFSAFKSPPAPTTVPELNTQQILAAITPRGFSAVKKGPFEPINEPSPATATPVKPGKQMKRASFAAQAATDPVHPQSSNAPIKDYLKVSKVVCRERKGMQSPQQLSQPSLFGKLGLDMETSDEDGSSQKVERLLGASSYLPGKGHPRCLPASSAPLLTGNTLTSIGSLPQQDAQVELGRREKEVQDGDNGREDRDGFNLASAMDDLGSFLGTWDAEKEASDFGSATSSGCVKSILRSK